MSATTVGDAVSNMPVSFLPNNLSNRPVREAARPRAAGRIRLALALTAAAFTAAAPAKDDPANLDLSVLRSLDGLGSVEIRADRANLSATERSTFSGNVEIVREEGRVAADAATYDPVTRRFSVEGDVRYEDDSVRVSAGEALFKTETDEGEFRRAQFELKDRDGRGDAESIRSDGSNFLVLDGVRYSACPVGENDWRLVAREIRLDKDTDIGTGKSVRVEFKGTPILYTPYISFPASGARKSGFLLPDYGNTERSGTELSLPYYWNMAPNYDAIVTARHFTTRGTQLAVEGRYLFANTIGSLDVEYLANDRLTDTERYLSTWQHETRTPGGLSVRADISDVSDGRYISDLSSSLASTSITHLERLLEIELDRGAWMLAARTQAFQTIDPSISADNLPYKRLPQLSFAGRWGTNTVFNMGLDAELAHFERVTGARGQRLDLEPSLRLPLESAGYSIVPEVRVSHTRYALDELPVGSETNPSRTTPVYSLDGRLVFERNAGRNSSLLHTVEPRIRYTHIPFTEQGDLPVFDTGLPDFNLIRLFQDNRYAGVDRIGDTDKLSVGVTTRLFDTGDGRELLSATLGQALFLSDRDVQLPNRPVSDDPSSNLIAEIALNLSAQPVRV